MPTTTVSNLYPELDMSRFGKIAKHTFGGQGEFWDTDDDRWTEPSTRENLKSK
jgi:hypothetical protein